MRITFDFDPFAAAVPALPKTAPPLIVPNDPAPPVAQATFYRQLPFLPALRACTACGCRQEARQVVPGIGPADARILVVGQNPGDDEDQSGEPFVGGSGREFDGWLKILGLDRRKLVVTNAVKCHTKDNRTPSVKEVKTCTNLWLADEIQALTSVTTIIPLGKPAVVAVLGKSAPPMTPLMAHHYRVKVFDRELHVFPLPHPAYLLRARHLAPMFRETILGHVRLTFEDQIPEAYQWSR